MLYAIFFRRCWAWDVIFGRQTAWRHGTAQISLGFQLYRTGFYRIEVVVVARKESQPAVRPRAGSASIQHRRTPLKARLCCPVFFGKMNCNTVLHK